LRLFSTDTFQNLFMSTLYRIEKHRTSQWLVQCLSLEAPSFGGGCNS